MQDPQERLDLNYQREVNRYLKRNATVQILNGMFGQTGVRLVQAPTFIPAYLFELSGSDFVVGLARSLEASGRVFSPFFGASLIGHRERILSTTLILGVVMRLQILGMAMAGFLLSSVQALYAVIAFLALMGFFQGMSQVTLNSLRAKVIPVKRRGVIAGARSFLAGLTSALVSYFAGAYLVENNFLGNGYASVFLLAFAIGVAGMAIIAFTREPHSVKVRDRASTREVVRSIPGLLRDDPAFAKFFIARALAAFGRMAMPFYILFAATRMDISGSELGLLTLVWMITPSITNMVWGILADSKGHRIVMVSTLALWILSHLLLLFVTELVGMALFFALMGLSRGGFVQSGQNLILEFGRVENVPLRLAASSAAVSLIAAIGPVLGGVILAFSSYQSLFITCMVLQGLALSMLIFTVPEPRRLRS
ncbi:MAG: MFS transporter [Marinobacter sp.]|uniref:MFS transporter n=1 Tax=Marinobacter sp. TaxID=50741 RepID=UPI0034A03786